MFRKKKDKEEAVSPVIGVVLLLGLTVILVSLLAIYIFDVFNETPEYHNIGVTAKLDNNVVSITYQSGIGGNSLDYLLVNLYNNTGSKETGSLPIRGVGEESLERGSYKWLDPQVGETITIGNFPSNEHLVITAYFNGSSSQVVLDKYF